MRSEYRELTAGTKPPFWQFVGTVAVLTFAIYMWTEARKDDEKYHEMVNAPEVGDIYRYLTEDGNYSTFKVYGSQDDSIDLIPNMYEFTTKKGMDEIELDSNYADLYFTYAKKDILHWIDVDTLFKVKRP